MCGITAEVSHAGIPDTRAIRDMTSVIRHRGPDDEGYVLLRSKDSSSDRRFGRDTVGGAHRGNPIEDPVQDGYDVALGHRRLSIIDLSPRGHQPMTIDGGRAWIVFNGEIYNYLELRHQLTTAGHAFTSESDTEVILRAYLEWGIDCLTKFNGMWAFCLWDSAERLLFCARDRFGVKPLYYWSAGEDLIAASEIKAVLAHPRVEARVNERIVYDFVGLGLLDHTAETFFDGVFQVPPGHHLVHRPGERPRLTRYWSLEGAARAAEGAPLDCQDPAGTLHDLFTDAVRLHLRSDVPVGTCLSGGLDSSAIVGTVRELLASGDESRERSVGERQRTFTAVFPGLSIDESAYVEEVVRANGVAGRETSPSGEGVWRELERMMWHQDEPVQGSSVYAQWNVMRLAGADGVKVLLDGQGADELFAGYRVYLGVYLNELLLSGAWRCLAGELAGLPRATDLTYGRILREWGRAASYRFPESTQRLVRRRLRVGERMLNPELRRYGKVHEPIDHGRGHDLATALIRDATVFNLPSLLHYEDRNSMAFSVEARVPFLDHRVAELAAILPAEWKIRAGRSKFVLREAMAGVVPPAVLARRDKKGFVTPHQAWMRQGEPFLRDLLLEPESRASRFLDQGAVAAALGRALASDGPLLGMEVWRAASLEAWMRAFDL